MFTRTFPLDTCLPPKRKVAPFICSSVISGTSEVSISSSLIALMRSHSVCEPLKVDFLLMFCCLSYGNDADLIPLFGMCDHNNRTIEKSKGDEALFSVVETIIFKGKGEALKDLLCIDKIKTMFDYVGPALLFIPCEFHLFIICMIMQILKNNSRRCSEVSLILIGRRFPDGPQDEEHPLRQRGLWTVRT